MEALHDEWRQHPPLSAMVAAYLGIAAQEQAAGEELIARLASMPGVKKE